MKLKSLVLGSALAGMAMTSVALAADPPQPARQQVSQAPVMASVCDALGISGLIIASRTNCLKITGEVRYRQTVEWEEDAGVWETDISRNTVTWFIEFDAANKTDFGPAHAVVRVRGVGDGNGDDLDDNDDWAPLGDVDIDNVGGIVFNRAFVSIGEGTVIAGGLKPTIMPQREIRGFTNIFSSNEVFNDNDIDFSGDPISHVTRDVGEDIDVGGIGLTITHEFGDGITAGIGVENKQNDGDDTATLVAFVEFEQGDIDAFLEFVAGENIFDIINTTPDWEVAGGLSAELDILSVSAGFWVSSNGEWDAIASAEAGLDIVTLAIEFYAQDHGGAIDPFQSVSGTAEFGLMNDITLRLGAAWESDDDIPVAAELAFELDGIGESAEAFIAGGTILGTGPNSGDWFIEGRLEVESSDTITWSIDALLENADRAVLDLDVTWNPDGTANFVATYSLTLEHIISSGVNTITSAVDLRKQFQ